MVEGKKGHVTCETSCSMNPLGGQLLWATFGLLVVTLWDDHTVYDIAHNVLHHVPIDVQITALKYMAYSTSYMNCIMKHNKNTAF